MKKFATVSAVASLCLISFRARSADWPNWRGPDHNGTSKETGWSARWPAEGPKTLWKAKVGTGFASFAVSNGRVYTSGNAKENAKETDTVFCFDAATGKELWKHSHAANLDPKYYDGGPSATPTVAGDRVYTFSKRGVVNCLEAAKGTVIWSKNLAEELKAKMPTWGFAGSVLIEGDLALLNIGSAGAALDTKSGKVIWSSGPEEAGYSTPAPIAVGGKRAAAFATKQHVVAINVADGKELWRFTWKTTYDVNAADPIFSGSKVFISSGYGHGGGVFDTGGKPPKAVWENKEMRNHMNSCVLWQGHLYGVDESQLRCLDFGTGAVKWTEKATGKGSLVLADGKLIVLGEKGELMVAPASPDGFKPVARAQVLGGRCWTTPVLANGKIYCRNAAGDVVCVDAGGN